MYNIYGENIYLLSALRCIRTVLRTVPTYVQLAGRVRGNAHRGFRQTPI